MRLLGVDFGEKRIGLAISDADAIVATPYGVVERRSDRQAVDEILRLTAEEGIGAIVVGEPRGGDGARGAAARRARGFARKLSRRSGLTVSMTNEILTSHEARRRAPKARAGDPHHDALAAQIILQQAIDEPASVEPVEPSRARGAGP